MNVEKELKIIANLKAGRPWSELAPLLAKDEAMPQTVQHFVKIIAMDDELIHEMRAEISDLKSKVNRLEQKLAQRTKQYRDLLNTTDPG